MNPAKTAEAIEIPYAYIDDSGGPKETPVAYSKTYIMRTRLLNNLLLYSLSFRPNLLNEVGIFFGILNYVCVVVKRFTFAISSPDERLFKLGAAAILDFRNFKFLTVVAVN